MPMPTTMTTTTRRLAFFALAVLTFVAYLPVLDASFINYDDPYYIVRNPHVPDGLSLSGARWALTTGYMANWHPLAWISHMLDVSVFGMNPTGHHATSLLIHVANTVLVARLLIESTNLVPEEKDWRSIAVAALFGLHPFHVESVAWISERKDVLCTLFWILTMIAWVRWTRKPSIARYLAAVALFALALASKPMAVTLPFGLLLFDVWPLGRLRVFGVGPAAPADQTISIGQALREKVPLFALAMASSVVTYLVQASGGAMDLIETRVPIGGRIANAFVSYARYVGKTIVPIDLAIVYPHPGTWPLVVILCSVLGFAAVTVALVRLGKGGRAWLPVSWFFFVGTLVPTIGVVVQVGAQSMADRYMYVPIVGLFVILVWAVGDLLEKYAPAQTTTLGAAVAAVVLLICGGLTFRQAGYFKDGVTVFRHAVAVTGPNALANMQLGSALSHENKLVEAESAYRAAVAAAPRSAVAHTNLGALLLQENKVDEAIAQQEIALGIDPSYAIAHYQLGIAVLRRGEMPRAVSELERAVRLAPESAEAHAGLGLALSEKGDLDAAIGELQTAIRISPHGMAEARDSLGIAYVRAGRLDEAVATFAKSVAMDPGRAVGHANYGNALVEAGRLDEGIAELELAARLEPGNAVTRYGLASALFARGRVPEAIAQYRESLRIDPSNEIVRRELATALKALQTRGPQ